MTLPPATHSPISATSGRLHAILAGRDHGFRWRGKDISRIEGLSDAVFAFALTLLVVSLEVPKTYIELAEKMRGFLGFAVCFVLLIMIWHAQYIYFRRYALDDRLSFQLNAALLFTVAFYVYPLKFLFSTTLDALTGHAHLIVVNGVARPPVLRGEWRSLMAIYSAGFIVLYGIFAALYAHAYRLRDALELDALELHETRAVVHENLAMVCIGSIALMLAARNGPQLSGLTYALIGPVQTILGTIHGRRRKAIAAEMAAASAPTG